MTKPFLPSERQKTDDSLNVERDKTNESISKSQTATENKIDQSVIDERTKADETTHASRDAADSNRDAKRNSKDYNVQDELKNSDDRLQEERRRADIAINLERKRVDVAIDNEREIKNAHSGKLLERERKITDQNLKDERAQTDSEVNQTSGKLELELTEHSKTKISLTSRDEFLAIVSHDLRNPIGAASSCAGMLLEDPMYEKMDPEIRHWVTFIKRNVDTSLRLIADLLDVERIAQGKIMVHKADTKIGDVVREAVGSFAHLAASKSVLLKIEADDILLTASCDSDRIRQVISNLLGNAIKFTPQGGSVTIQVGETENNIEISVTDTGSGIPKDRIDQIFERFAQFQTKDRSGLGLGLYISKMLVEAHGGSLKVESIEGAGSRFSFSIPRS